MSAGNEKLIGVSFDDGIRIFGVTMSRNDNTGKLIVTSDVELNSIPINDTNLNYNAENFKTELGFRTELGGVTNLGLIQSYMMLRTICDIRKDAINATTAVCNRNYLTYILKQIFPVDLVDKASLPKLEEIKAVSNNYCRNDISGRVFIKSAYTDHIPIPVQYVFNESGAKPDTFSPEGATIMSSFASVADPATRTEPTDTFPGLDFGLQFDRNFMELVGFLKGTDWYAVQTSLFDIHNTNHTEYSFSINVGKINVGNDGDIVSGNNVTDSSIAINPFSCDTGYYFQGNPTKNKFINNNPDNVPEILKYMIIKEMGDMMQVYVMLVWWCFQGYLRNIENKLKMKKNEFVMSTTDLVVMNTCQLFQMPCLYTNQGKDSTMLTGEDKTNFEDIYKKKIAVKANGKDEYNNWKKNNKFANTLYYLPITETKTEKLKRTLYTIYQVINSQNKKQLDIFKMANFDNLRYIKMGRLGPLMTSFSKPNIIKIIIGIIIQNIEKNNENLLNDYRDFSYDLNKSPNDYNDENLIKEIYDKGVILLKKKFSLDILITRQQYPPDSNKYVYVIQNVTHYTVNEPIGNGKLVDMILDAISNEDTTKFHDIQIYNIPKRRGSPPPPLDNIISTNPIVPGPNEYWLIYSIANWFNVVHKYLNNWFGPVFKRFNFSDNVDTMNWTGVGGTNHEYHGSKNGDNSLQQPYIHIGFVTMIPSIYEQLCSIYEKHDVVYDDDFGKNFIVDFILNLTRYYKGPPDNENPTGKPMLTPPYNNIGGSNPPNGSNPFHTPVQPYEKQVIHSNDTISDIKNIRNIDNKFKEFKERLEHELTINLNEQVRKNDEDKNVFTVHDYFARKLIIKSGLTFNVPIAVDEERMDVGEGMRVGSGEPPSYSSPVRPIDNRFANATTRYDVDPYITPMVVNPRGVAQVNKNISPQDKVETTGLDIQEDMTKKKHGGTFGGKIIKNKKTRRRMGRTRHKKHHKTNKKHKKHQTSCKNKTRKTKKSKRKNKTR